MLRGYRYQLLQSLDAWLRLQPSEILWLETEEDFSITSATTALDAQVKSSAAASGPRSHSLKSTDVRAALSRFWTRSAQGLDEKPYLAFIAKGGAAHEQGLVFPDGLPGIEYWGVAASGADTTPIRVALATLFEGEPLGDWIRGNPSDDELRVRLLRRVRWMLRALDENALSELIRDKIAELYLLKGFLVTLADEAQRSLLDRLLETASQPSAENRRLTAIDLHRSLELAAGPTVALQTAARAFTGLPGAPNVDGLFVTRVNPPTGNTISRIATAGDILERSRGQPVIWLHGAHGTGKSTLARLIAAQSGGVWLEIDLRTLQDDPKAALTAWRELVSAIIRTARADGVIIDDLGGLALQALRNRLVGLAEASLFQTRIIVTSTYEPSGALLSELGASPAAAVTRGGFGGIQSQHRRRH